MNERQRRSDRQHEPRGLADKQREAEVLVEAQRGIILGVDNEGERHQIRSSDTPDGVDEQRLADAFALMGGRDREPTEQTCRDKRVAWRFLRDIVGKLVEGN